MRQMIARSSGRRPAVSLIALLLLVAAPAVGQEPKQVIREREPRKWALLVGVNEYVHLGGLNYCSRDIEALREQFLKSGFGERQLYVLRSDAEQDRNRPFRSNIEDTLDLLLGTRNAEGKITRPGLVEEGDLVVIAYGGHGVHFDGASYLCPTDARLDRRESLLPVASIYERLAASPAGMKLMLIDACRNDPRPEGGRSAGESPSAHFSEALRNPPKGILVLASCSPEEVSWEEGDLRHGVFMHFVLEGLRGKADRERLGNKDSEVSLLELFRYVNEETRAYVAFNRRAVQTPQMWGELAGDYVLAKLAASTGDIPPQPDPPTRPMIVDRVPPMGEWPLFGGAQGRGAAAPEQLKRVEFDPDDPAALRWKVKTGTVSYGSPVIAGGQVFVGTNNAAELRAGVSGDRGVLAAFDIRTGAFRWQLTRDKLSTGRVNDWPMQGICSTPCVVEDRLYVVTNRCELMCLDTAGFTDGENNGPFREETLTTARDADIVWSLDMMGELGVHPHNMSTSSPVVAGGRVFAVTSNGCAEWHMTIPAQEAPALVAVDESTGKVLWTHRPEEKLLHGQWCSPSVGNLGGVEAVVYGAGDGWVYALDTTSGELLWKFDANPKESKWVLGGRGTRNNIIGMPVISEGRVYVVMGQDHEHGEGIGCLWCIDGTKRGDISAELGERETAGRANSNSGVVWKYDHHDANGNTTIDFEETFHRSISTIVLHGDLLFAVDFSGLFHCLDRRSGRPHWTYDLLAATWSSPVVMGDKVMICDEDGDINVFAASSRMELLGESIVDNSIYTTPTLAGGTVYIGTRNMLYAFRASDE